MWPHIHTCNTCIYVHVVLSKYSMWYTYIHTYTYMYHVPSEKCVVPTPTNRPKPTSRCHTYRSSSVVFWLVVVSCDHLQYCHYLCHHHY